MLTEEEAKTKWCPFVRFAVSESLGCSFSNRVDHTDEFVRALSNSETKEERDAGSSRCLASDCMAWRWVEPPGPRHTDMPERDNRGWCGLAGKP